MVKGCFMDLEGRVGSVILPSALRDGDAEDGAQGLGTGVLLLCFSPRTRSYIRSSSPGPAHRS